MCDDTDLNDESFDKVLSDYKALLERACADKYIFNPEVQRRFHGNADSDRPHINESPEIFRKIKLHFPICYKI